MVTGLVVKKAITYKHFNSINVLRWHNISHKHVMYFNFTIRLLELESVSSKQTYLGVVEQLITEKDNINR